MQDDPTIKPFYLKWKRGARSYSAITRAKTMTAAITNVCDWHTANDLNVPKSVTCYAVDHDLVLPLVKEK